MAPTWPHPGAVWMEAGGPRSAPWSAGPSELRTGPPSALWPPCPVMQGWPLFPPPSWPARSKGPSRPSRTRPLPPSLADRLQSSHSGDSPSQTPGVSVPRGSGWWRNAPRRAQLREVTTRTQREDSRLCSVSHFSFFKGPCPQNKVLLQWKVH